MQSHEVSAVCCKARMLTLNMMDLLGMLSNIEKKLHVGREVGNHLAFRSVLVLGLGGVLQSPHSIQRTQQYVPVAPLLLTLQERSTGLSAWLGFGGVLHARQLWQYFRETCSRSWA
ncbi:hypothetical protein LTR56_005393, partial [Elasticomyces elasticus]